MEYIQIHRYDSLRLYKRMATEEVIFSDDFEDLMVRSHPTDGYFVKRKGTAEYRIEGSSKLVTETILGGKVVDRTQYDVY